jgi:AcrR family transcriptional regulator
MDTQATTPRQREILDRTLELVGKVGLAGLTTKRIAESVGFAEAALYRHFPTKQALILGLMDRLEDMLLGPIRVIAADGATRTADRLERILRVHTALIREHNSLPILLLAEASASGDPALIDRMRSIFHAYLSLLEGLVREGQSDGDLVPNPDAESLALAMLGAPAALAIRHRLIPDERREESFERNLIPFLIAAVERTRS